VRIASAGRLVPDVRAGPVWPAAARRKL